MSVRRPAYQMHCRLQKQHVADSFGKVKAFFSLLGMAISGMSLESLAGGGALEGLEAGLALVSLCCRVLYHSQ